MALIQFNTEKEATELVDTVLAVQTSTPVKKGIGELVTANTLPVTSFKDSFIKEVRATEFTFKSVN
jgi:hypothetical protein